MSVLRNSAGWPIGTNVADQPVLYPAFGGPDYPRAMKFKFMRQRGIPIPKPKKPKQVLAYPDDLHLPLKIVRPKKRILYNGRPIPARYATLQDFLTSRSTIWEKERQFARIKATFDKGTTPPPDREIFVPRKLLALP